MTSHALSAKAIKAELALIFPKIKFSVRGESFSQGNAVRISYEDGVLRSKIEAIVSKYSSEKKRDSNLPQVRFVSVSRIMSAAAKMTVGKSLGWVGSEMNGLDTDGEFKSAKIWQLFCTHEYGVYAGTNGLQPSDIFQGGQASSDPIILISEGAEVDLVSDLFDRPKAKIIPIHGNAKEIIEFDPNGGEPFNL